MRFGSFVFPVSQNPVNDHRIIDETLEEIILCDERGFDAAVIAADHRQRLLLRSRLNDPREDLNDPFRSPPAHNAFSPLAPRRLVP